MHDIRDKLRADTGALKQPSELRCVVSEYRDTLTCVRKRDSFIELFESLRTRRDGIFVALRVKEKRYTAVDCFRAPQLIFFV